MRLPNTSPSTQAHVSKDFDLRCSEIARRLAPRNLKEHDMQPQPLVVTDDELNHIFSRDADRARPP